MSPFVFWLLFFANAINAIFQTAHEPVRLGAISGVLSAFGIGMQIGVLFWIGDRCYRSNP